MENSIFYEVRASLISLRSGYSKSFVAYIAPSQLDGMTAQELDEEVTTMLESKYAGAIDNADATLDFNVAEHAFWNAKGDFGEVKEELSNVPFTFAEKPAKETRENFLIDVDKAFAHLVEWAKGQNPAF